MKKILDNQGNATSNASIKDLITLLNTEITAINKGYLDHVLDLYDKKTLLLEKLESASPNIESQLLTDTNTSSELRKDLTELLDLIQKDAHLLANMTATTKEIIVEIARIRGRHSLDGLYSSAGETHPKAVLKGQQIDRSV